MVLTDYEIWSTKQIKSHSSGTGNRLIRTEYRTGYPTSLSTFSIIRSMLPIYAARAAYRAIILVSGDTCNITPLPFLHLYLKMTHTRCTIHTQLLGFLLFLLHCSITLLNQLISRLLYWWLGMTCSLQYPHAHTVLLWTIRPTMFFNK